MISEEQMQSALSADLQAILRCLNCSSRLTTDNAGGYVCPACKRAYPNVNGIARFVDAQHYAASFASSGIAPRRRNWITTRFANPI